ncbi:FtsX-like permease family protein [Maribellus comscasis]|uniref:FtsX-like permease family protein n=1 Tax=Maribellus comscasis TaxID=2681766 RepID=A0A6I6JY33_9BACT|nr:FtsX-like permease family protein [Maribellus comscasis]QGY45082.1 FtsX-like permease family protein [Maribellus comscasis]
MNTELFIARKLFFDKSNKKYLSHKIIRIALFGIALGLAVMIISVAVVTGFKNEIRSKIVGFGSHIQIINFDSNNSYETKPISKNQAFVPEIKKIKGINRVDVYATKPGMIKTDEYLQGIVFKGVDKDYNWDFFRKNLIEGRIPALNDSARVNEIILSEQVLQLLHLKLNDDVFIYFLNEDENLPRILQLKVCGIYRTGLEEFDNVFILGDLKHIQRLNDWQNDQISGFEITVDNFFSTEEIEQRVRNQVISYSEENSTILRTLNITREYPQIFDWLSVIDMNVWVILILLSVVAGFNMISGLLVLILERINMIGILKALGSPNWSVRKVFLYLSFFLTGSGMLWGNIIAIAIIIIQKVFHVVKLDPAMYYVDVAPVNFSILHILILNLASITITIVMLIIPSFLISKISPEKAIRFD